MEQDMERKKDILKGCSRYDRDLKVLGKQLEKLEQDKDFQDGKYNSADYLRTYQKLRSEIEKMREQKIHQYSAIFQSINGLTDENEKRVLYLHYIEGMTWEQVCTEMNYSWCQVHRFHRKALGNLYI